MKTHSLLLLLLSFVQVFPLFGETPYKEERRVIYSSEAPERPYLLQPGHSLEQTVSFPKRAYPTRKFLRVTGGVKMPAPFQERGEEMFRRSEFFIDDNLDSVVTRKDCYSLYFKGENDAFERYAYFRVMGEALKPGKLTVHLPVVRRRQLTVDVKGRFGLELELYYKKPGRAAQDIFDTPDSVLFVPVPVGTGKYQDVSHTFTLPDNVACALLCAGGSGFSGECWLEAPRLEQNGKTVWHVPFTKFAQKASQVDYWVGCNLATRSWPRWRLEFDGREVFEGNIFDRASNVADFYILLPGDLQGTGCFKLSLLKEPHRAAFPYEVRTLEVIEETARDFEIISVPKYVSKSASFGVLIETNRPNVKLQVKSDAALQPATQEVRFKEAGLHVVEFRADSCLTDVKMEFSDGSRSESAAIEQIVERAPENIYISSGDEIYIDKQYTPYSYFFKWYISQRVGNWYQFRPSYQWSGCRITDPEIIGYYTHLLDGLKIPYAWQAEGRTLAGSRLNPSNEELASPMFRGKQAHENDGGYYYWQHFKYQGLHSDMAARNRPWGGIFAKHRPIYTDHGTFIHYDTEAVTDMADGARKLVSNLRYSKGESVRHTGPSSLFRYFYQAGYEWVGAEQMYGPEETILSALRGASLAYSRPTYGSLHAMQWGSGPFTDPKHSLRLYLSLAVAYMHGSSHINTEEALWTDEFMNDRYSPSGKEHLAAQHRVLDFIETHSRRGEFHSNIAVIQGRNDAWKSFGRGSLWSQEGEKWKFNKACESFDLLKVFYPDHIIDGCGPEGWFTSTPYGPVDLLPVEAPQDVMNRYKAMIFLGWNTYDKGDFERIRDYVFHGGTLILSAAHINACLQPDEKPCFLQDDAPVRELLGEDYRSLMQQTTLNYGKGKVIYFPEALYPAEDKLKAAYIKVMQDIAASTVHPEAENGWIEAAPSVGFTAWQDGERRTLYVLNTDWQSDEETHPYTFIYGKGKFRLSIARYQLGTIHCAAQLAAAPSSNTTDVLSIVKESDGWTVRVQTTGPDTVKFMFASNGLEKEVSFSSPGIHVYKLSL